MRNLEGRIVVYTSRHEEVRPLLEKAWPGLPLEYGQGRDFLSNAIGDAEIRYTYGIPHDVLKKARRLRWIQGVGAGADQFMPFENLPPGVLVTNAPEINADIMADFAIGCVRALQFNLKRYVNQQCERRWERELPKPLAGKTLAIIGLGRIGKGVARRAKAMGMRVVGTRWTGASGPDVTRSTGPRNCIGAGTGRSCGPHCAAHAGHDEPDRGEGPGGHAPHGVPHQRLTRARSGRGGADRGEPLLNLVDVARGY